MSVIASEHLEESKIQSMENKRIAFAGSMGSGKSYAAKQLKKKYGENTTILSLATAIKNLASGSEWFDCREGYQMIGTVGRSIDPEAWVKTISKQITNLPNNTNIIVDDVRFENEVIALRNLGFKIVYMDTPWDTRLKRIQERYKTEPPAFGEFVEWFTHESEVQLMDLPPTIFDLVVTDEKGLKKVVEL